MADPDGEDRERTLREQVEEKYDFENFGPADMAEMTVEEWEAAFDSDTWITGQRLLDRVEATLKDRVTRRELFAIVERDGDRVLAYSDVDYVLVHPNGDVEGEGPLRREVEPVVALCSMADYEVPEAPGGELLPDPEDVQEGSGDLGNQVLQVVAGAQVLAGLILIISPLFVDLSGRGTALLTSVVGLVFVLVGVFLFLLVANARLSGRFRAEEYRRRLRAAGVGSDERPEFLPVGEGDEREDGEG